MILQGYHFSNSFHRQFRKLLQDWFVYLRDSGDPFDQFHPLVLAADISQIQADELLQQIDLGFEAEAETAIRHKHGYDSGPRYYEHLSPEARVAMAGEIVALFRKTPEALAEMGPGLEYSSSWWRGWQPPAEPPPGFSI